MMTFVIVLHVLVCFLLILSILLQPGNKGGMGSAFGGAGGATVFGGRGANTFLAKLTAAAAVVFMVTSMTLVYLSSKTGSAFERVGVAGAKPEATQAADVTGAGEGEESPGATGKAAPAGEAVAAGQAAPEGKAAPANPSDEATTNE